MLQLNALITQWSIELGFAQVGVSDIDLSQQQAAFKYWLAQCYHGDMDWMARNQEMRLDPTLLLSQASSHLPSATIPKNLRMISVRLNYFPKNSNVFTSLTQLDKPYVSRYALGRDYHKIMRKRLQQLADRINDYCQNHLAGKVVTPLEYRPFVDSAPVLERPLAAKAGLGWVGKHSLLINEAEGSYFFIGELLINVPLPININVASKNCGQCSACRTICPTGAIVDDYIVDARRCISYLTIEHKGIIPIALRSKIGNRIYGCDDCQLVCPYNRQPTFTHEAGFDAKSFHQQSLTDLFQWNEMQFLNYFEGSAIRRIGFWQWLRNITIGIGNMPYQSSLVSSQIIMLLRSRLSQNEILDPHLLWAIEQQEIVSTHIQMKAEPLVNRQQHRLARIVERIRLD